MSNPEPSDVGPKYGGDLRASDSDRDQVITVLSTAYAEGRLTKSEHDERMATATTARTFDDLIPLTRDLVPIHTPIRPYLPAPSRSEGRRPVIDRRSTGESESVVAIFGGSSRKGAWRVRRKINMIALFGGSELDFTDAIFEADTIEITGFWMFGGGEIKVPEGVEITDQIVGIFGGSEVKHTKPVPGGPKIVIKGVALFGGCEVTGPKSNKKSKK